MIIQSRPKRKKTGGLFKAHRGKKKSEIGRMPTLTKVATEVRKSVRTIGGNSKPRLLATEFANVTDPKTKKTKKVKIKTVVENNANRNYIRRNVITMGCTIDTELGQAKVTSRPGQSGIVSAVLIK